MFYYSILLFSYSILCISPIRFLIRCEYDILIGSIHFRVFYSVNRVIFIYSFSGMFGCVFGYGEWNRIHKKYR